MDKASDKLLIEYMTMMYTMISEIQMMKLQIYLDPYLVANNILILDVVELDVLIVQTVTKIST